MQTNLSMRTVDWPILSRPFARTFGSRCHTHLLPPLVWRGWLSIQAMSWVFEHSESRLAARHVLLSIANHAKSDGTGAWPSTTTIARESRLSRREVQRSLRELIDLGELTIELGAGPHGTNLYSIPGVTTCRPPAPIGRQGATSTPPKRDFGDQMSPEPSLREPSNNHDDILWAIEESEKTGVPADELLKKRRIQ